MLVQRPERGDGGAALAVPARAAETMTEHHRLESLDVFRGLSIAAMILVNNPGDWNSVFPALVHANWNGWTFADVVFPFFVFIMGCAMPFAFARRDAAGVWRADLRLLRRAAALVALGL